MTATEIAVVIPTRDRETRLAFTLDALAAQSLASERFEVFVVRAEDQRDQARTRPPAGLRVREIFAARPGTARQRNAGWRASDAPIVAFTDDDCRPSREWLASLIEAGAGAAVVQGRTEPDPDERHLLTGLARTIRNVHASGWYETCNIAYPRELLADLDGFADEIDFLGEDADLGARAIAAGAQFRFSDDALVWHAVHWRSLAGALRDARKRGSRPEIVARHPSLRRALWLGLFADRDHARTLLAVLGVAVSRRFPRLGCLAVLPYVKHRVDRSRLTPWGLLRLPTQFGARALVDLVELGAFVVASIRSRSIVL
jgi:GT2 family glycosyltransferase